LLLGWIGLLFGFQFEISKLRRFPVEFFIAAILEGAMTFLFVFFGVILFFKSGLLNINLPGSTILIIAFTLSAAAACTAQTGVVLLARDKVVRHRQTVKILRYISSIDGLFAIVIFGVAIILHPEIDSGSPMVNGLGWTVFISLSACSGLLILYILFLAQRREESELALVVIGMVMFTSGASSVLNISPLFTNFFIGFCLVNLTREKEKIFNILVTIEKPVYLLLLVFLGRSWQLSSVWIIFLAVIYCMLRAAGKIIGGFIITRLGPALKPQPSRLGFGLLEQGGLAMAILFDYHQNFPGDTTAQVISLALFAIIYNEFLSPNFLNRLLKDE
jgi:Kef-type K+ transport system membrane component KefB